MIVDLALEGTYVRLGLHDRVVRLKFGIAMDV